MDRRGFLRKGVSLGASLAVAPVVAKLHVVNPKVDVDNLLNRLIDAGTMPHCSKEVFYSRSIGSMLDDHAINRSYERYLAGTIHPKSYYV